MDYSAFFKITLGLYILGGVDETGKKVGSVVDAIAQIANKPWLIAISCHNTSYTKEVIQKTKKCSVSVLSKDINPLVIADFGFKSSREYDKWAKHSHTTMEEMPILDNCLAYFAADIIKEIPFESNTLFIAEVKDCFCTDCSQEPLTYADYRNYFKAEVIKALR